MTKENKPIAKECRFAIHIPENRRQGTPDLHMVKEQIHYENGDVKPNLKFIRDFQRSFGVVKPSKRTYEQKREWSSLDDLLIKECTQSKLRDEIAKLLDKGWSNDHLKKLSQSPYLYGSDITSTSLIKKMYMDRYPNHNTPYTIATYDVETDVVNGTDNIIMASVIFKNDIYIAVTKDFVRGHANLESVLHNKAQTYIGDVLDEYKMKIELCVCEDVVEVITKTFSKVHEFKPDFLAIWNMDYDIPKILANLEKYGVDPKTILCDPSVPSSLRICNYKQGPKKKITASGKVIPINPAAQWHTLQLTASFYVIDAMCTYKHIRLGEQEESSYSLDAILKKKINKKKLKFEQADAYSGLQWHQYMQSNYPIEYMVYNIYDCLAMIELDNTTKDLQFTLPTFSATSDFWNFKSQPRRIADALHFFALEKGYMMGTVGSVDEPVEIEKSTDPDEEQEEESKTLDLTGWILTLPAHMSVLGLPLIKEDPTMRTGIRAYVFDSDSVSAYPSCTSVANVSKTTTKRELISIEGIEEDIFRMQNLNLIAGESNAIEYCCQMFNAPGPGELLKKFNEV